MSAEGEKRPAFGHRSAEMVVAALFFLLGAIAVWDSVRLGARWADDGPQAGYFPCYIGLIVCAAAAVNLVLAWLSPRAKDRTFVELGQLKLVLTVLVPAAIYVASALYIGFFMRWLGKYPWWKVAVVSIGNSVVFFLIFEIWFKVPLPKGPLENLLGVG